MPKTLPQLDYCHVMWGCTTTGNTAILYKNTLLQIRMARLILKANIIINPSSIHYLIVEYVRIRDNVNIDINLYR